MPRLPRLPRLSLHVLKSHSPLLLLSLLSFLLSFLLLRQFLFSRLRRHCTLPLLQLLWAAAPISPSLPLFLSSSSLFPAAVFEVMIPSGADLKCPSMIRPESRTTHLALTVCALVCKGLLFNRMQVRDLYAVRVSGVQIHTLSSPASSDLLIIIVSAAATVPLNLRLGKGRQ